MGLDDTAMNWSLSVTLTAPPELIWFHIGSSANVLSKSDAPNWRWAFGHAPLKIHQEFPTDHRFQRQHARARTMAELEVMTFTGCPVQGPREHSTQPR